MMRALCQSLVWFDNLKAVIIPEKKKNYHHLTKSAKMKECCWQCLSFESLLSALIFSAQEKTYLVNFLAKFILIKLYSFWRPSVISVLV